MLKKWVKKMRMECILLRDLFRRELEGKAMNLGSQSGFVDNFEILQFQGFSIENTRQRSSPVFNQERIIKIIYRGALKTTGFKKNKIKELIIVGQGLRTTPFI